SAGLRGRLLAGVGRRLGREPFAVVAPHARAFLAFERLPGGGIDRARPPAILHHEPRRRERVERGDEIRGVAAEARRHPVAAERDVVALPHVVEREQLHHEVMDGAVDSLYEGMALLARIYV